jgi:hypothetical protein
VAAIHDGQLARVVQLARAWADERMDSGSDSAGDART